MNPSKYIGNMPEQQIVHTWADRYDYVQSTDPTSSINPSTLYATWLNTSLGQVSVCIDNTEDANVWVNQVTGAVTNSWEPTASDFVLWLDSWDTSTLTMNGDQVTAIADKSPSGGDYSGTHPNVPYLYNNGIRGKHALWFPGGSTYFASSFVPPASTEIQFYCVTTAQAGVIWDAYLGGNRGSFFYDWNISGRPTANGTYYDSLFDATLLRSKTVITRADMTNTYIQVHGNGIDGDVASYTAGTLQWDTSSSLYRLRTATTNYSGLFHELICVDSLLSTADQEKMEGYLAHKWDCLECLPDGHTYKVVPPLAA